MADLWLEPYEEAVAEFPVNGAPRAVFAAALERAVRAPSVHNTQPWFFRIHRGRLEIHADWRRKLAVADPAGRELVMSVGALLEHLDLVLRRFGYWPTIDRPGADEPTHLATVTLGPAGTRVDPLDLELCNAIGRRRTNRRPFRRRTVPAGVLDRAARRALQRGARLAIMATRSARGHLARLVTEADRRQLADPAFRRELASWLRAPSARRLDGVPSPSGKAPRLVRPIAPLLVRTFDVGRGVAAYDRRLATGSPVLAVLWTPGDDRVSWLDAGRALARVLLSLTADGVAASFLNQVTEVSDTRSELEQLLGFGARAQAVLRLGYGSVVPVTPRRPVAALLAR